MSAITLRDRWPELSAFLDAAEARGCRVSFWLRDDDAIEDTPALQRLLNAAAQHDTPLLLAVIPLLARRSLVSALATRSGVTIAMHGVRHETHAPSGRKTEELPVERGLVDIEAALAAGRERLTQLFGPTAARWYVPPWNRLDPTIARRLPDLGFEVLSTFAAAHRDQAYRLTVVNCHVDIIDWREGRVGRPRAWVEKEIIRQASAEKDRSAPLVGVLTHHLVHDETAWEVTRELIELIDRHPGARWVSPERAVMLEVEARRLTS